MLVAIVKLGDIGACERFAISPCHRSHMYPVGACGQELGRVQPRRRAGSVHGQSSIKGSQIAINFEASRSAHLSPAAGDMLSLPRKLATLDGVHSADNVGLPRFALMWFGASILPLVFPIYPLRVRIIGFVF